MLSNHEQQGKYYNLYSWVVQNIFLLVNSGRIAGLNRASTAIAIFTLIHGLLLSRLETGNKANLRWQDIVLKSDKARAATLKKMFRIPEVISDMNNICRPTTGLMIDMGVRK